MDTADRGLEHPGPFMLTLCQFDGPVLIRPPQSPQLKRFTFFTTSARRRDGGEHVYLHMGYFETLTDAQSLLEAVRRRFPNAIASRAPATLPLSNVWTPTLPEPPPGVPAAKSFAPVTDQSLTDTQVMRILETRGAAKPQSEVEEGSSAPIGMLRPEDTSTRRALKAAVVQGAPVYFAVQLDWSAKRIYPERVRQLPIFKTHTLYATESRREGGSRYFLRLGFFADAVSAKDIAFSVRSKFASAVVVAVTEQEVTLAHEASADTSLGFAQVHLPIYEERSGTGSPLSESNAGRPRRRRNTETLEQTLETLAEREMWNDPDGLNESGVRHLKVDFLQDEPDGS